MLRDQTELITNEAKSVRYYECVCILALVTRHATGIFSKQRYVVMRDQSGCAIFFHIISQKARFSETSY